ncbi:MAG: hypothetical protein ABN488_16970, partial [Methylobacteriaceae bacterium]
MEIRVIALCGSMTSATTVSGPTPNPQATVSPPAVAAAIFTGPLRPAGIARNSVTGSISTMRHTALLAAFL